MSIIAEKRLRKAHVLVISNVVLLSPVLEVAHGLSELHFIDSLLRVAHALLNWHVIELLLCIAYAQAGLIVVGLILLVVHALINLHVVELFFQVVHVLTRSILIEPVLWAVHASARKAPILIHGQAVFDSKSCLCSKNQLSGWQMLESTENDGGDLDRNFLEPVQAWIIPHICSAKPAAISCCGLQSFELSFSFRCRSALFRRGPCGSCCMQEW